MLKKAVVSALLICASGAALADQYVNGYIRKDGTYVQGHTKSSPNASAWDNKSSQTMGGQRRDEFSSTPYYNKTSPSYGIGDNDKDGVPNSIDQNRWQ